MLFHKLTEDGVTRLKKYSELSSAEATQADCDVKATNIILQALPLEIYALVSTHKVAKDLWEQIQMLMQGTSLTKQERECKLYDAFDKFAYQKGETLRDFYLRFSLPLNDMNMYNMKLEQFQFVPQESSSSNISISSPMNDTSSIINHNAYMASAPQIDYALIAHHPSEFPSPETGLVVLVFQKGDDPIDAINHMMSFLTSVVASRVTIQPIQGRQNHMSAGLSRPFTSESGGTSGRQRVLQEEELDFLAYPGTAESSTNQSVITTNAAYQAVDLDTYDSECDELNSAKFSLSIGEIVTHRFTLIVLSALRCSDNENMLGLVILILRSILMDLQAIVVPDTKETLMLAEESRSKMIEKQNDPQMIENKVITKSINYAIINQLSTDFETRFVSQTESSTEQAFWSQYSVQTDEPNLFGTTIVEVPKEHPKVSMVNSCLKKLKFHLASFDMVVKERITATAITEGTWGFKHTKACFCDDIIPFVKSLKELFTSFNQCLIDEVTEVQNIFTQMELAVEQHCEEKTKVQIKMENVLQENDRLLTQALSVEIVNIVVHENMKSVCLNVTACARCVTTESELKMDFLKNKCYDTLLQKYHTLEKHYITLEVNNQLNTKIFQRDTWSSQESAPTFAELFEINNLKAQVQAKDTMILKLKEKLNSLNGDVKERKVKRDVKEIETLNIELDHKVTKLAAENKHLKQTYRKLYDSVKSSRVRSKEQCDDLINKVNLKFAEVPDLNARLQEKVLVDVAPLVPKLHKNRTAHTDYIRHTQEEAATLREIIERVNLVSSASGSLSQDNTKHNRIRRTQKKAKKNKIEDHLRIVKSSLNKESVVDSKAISSVINSMINVNSDLKCASCCLNRPLKFLCTVKFGNDHVAKIMGYGDYQIRNVTISWVYYVEGLGHNLFSVGQFCDSDLEVAFRQQTCFICNLDGVDLLTSSRGNNLYTLSIQDMMTSSPICLLSKASKTKSWLWHRRLSHMNFGFINHLARQGLRLWQPFVLLKIVPLIRLRHGKTPYELLHSKLPDLSFFHLFGALCYSTNDSENLAIAPIAEVIPPGYVDSTGFPSSTTVEEDAPSSSNSPIPTDTQSSVIPQYVGDDNLDMEVAHMGNDPLFGVPILKVTFA
nr:integrase, catalytic region, zinc finger, CCHC-type, peptidase aspartic, catalytic [Tanacetum cinerariifolium]